MAMPIAAAEGGAPSSPQKRRVTPAPPAAASTGGGAAAPAAGAATALRLSDSLPGVEVHVPPSASGGSRLCVLRKRLSFVRDELAGVDRGIQEKEALRRKLDEKLVNIDGQLATPGLSAKDKDHLLAKWRSVDGDKQVSNAALAGLYHDKRRIKDSVVALEQEIGAEETARSKADTRVRVCRAARAHCLLFCESCDFAFAALFVCSAFNRYVQHAARQTRYSIMRFCVCALSTNDTTLGSCALTLCVVFLVCSCIVS